MDFDSIISIIILMLFFALPLIKRQIKAKKQKIKEELRTLKAKQKSFKPQKFTEQIQNFFKIPETSKSEPNQQNKKAKSIWETLASDIKKNEGYEDDSYIDSKSMQKEIIGKDTFEDAKKKLQKKKEESKTSKKSLSRKNLSMLLIMILKMKKDTNNNITTKKIHCKMQLYGQKS